MRSACKPVHVARSLIAALLLSLLFLSGGARPLPAGASVSPHTDDAAPVLLDKPPVAQTATFTVTGNTPLDFTLAATDPDSLTDLQPRYRARPRNCNPDTGMIVYETVSGASGTHTGTLFQTGAGGSVSNEIATTNTGTAGKTCSYGNGGSLTLTNTAPNTVP